MDIIGLNSRSGAAGSPAFHLGRVTDNRARPVISVFGPFRKSNMKRQIKNGYLLLEPETHEEEEFVFSLQRFWLDHDR